MQWTDVPCLVTGGAGFGGAHLVFELCARGARVIVLDRDTPSAAARMPRDALFYRGDVRDVDMIRAILSRHGVRVAFHLAAQPLVPIGQAEPSETLSINAQGTWAVLEAVRTLDLRIGFVFASSGAYYGTTTDPAPIPETAAPAPVNNVYAASKIAADVAVQTYARAFGVKAAICRFMNTYGPGDLHFSRLIPGALRKLLMEEPYDFGDREDGRNRLSYLYVRDMALAYLAVAGRLDEVAGEAFNFGTAGLVETREVVQLVSHLFDSVGRAATFSGKHCGISKRLDVSKAERVLGWYPQTDLESGLAETIAWYRAHWHQIAPSASRSPTC